MVDIIYRIDRDNPPRVRSPESAAEARTLLERGNEQFARLYRTDRDQQKIIPIDARSLGISDEPGEPPPQTPFAAILGCADARVPVDLVFHQAVNDLFAVRVAGNVLGNECLGSIEYASAHLQTVRLFVVLGHSHCGAVTAAVDAYSRPSQYPAVASSQGLRAIVDRILLSVRGASMALDEALGAGVSEEPGYRKALVETAVCVNAALTAMALKEELGREVVFGVYDLVSRRVRVPRAGKDEDFGLCDPPADLDELRELGLAIAGSTFVKSFLHAAP